MLKHIWSYCLERKKLWLLPIIVALIVFGAFLLVAPTNPYAPFIYSFF